ncbi:MAG: hypothetical protein ACRDH2_02480 [Anaerolineales bacterium]
MPLSNSQIEGIARQVYRQFPEMKAVRPAVQSQPSPKTPGAVQDRYLLTFKGQGRGPGGQAIWRIVRVVADARGKVIKISTSR